MKNVVFYIGLAIVVFGIVALGSSFVLPIKTDTLWYYKVLGINIVGTIVALLAKFGHKIPSFNKITSATIDRNLTLEPVINTDYECLNYLSRRFKAANNPEVKEQGLILAAKAHALLFKEYYEEVPANTAVIA